MTSSYRQVQQTWSPAKTGRTPTACVRCRRKQVKCDGARPRCRRCTWSNEGCVYTLVTTDAHEPMLEDVRPVTVNARHRKLLTEIGLIKGEMNRMSDEMRLLRRNDNASETPESDAGSPFSDSSFREEGSPAQRVPVSPGSREDKKLASFQASRFERARHQRPVKCLKQPIVVKHTGYSICLESSNKDSDTNNNATQLSRIVIDDHNHDTAYLPSVQSSWKLTITGNGIRIQTDIKTIRDLENFLSVSLPQIRKCPSRQKPLGLKAMFVLWGNRWDRYTNKTNAKGNGWNWTATIQPLASTTVMSIAISQDVEAQMLAYTRAHETEILEFVIMTWQICEVQSGMKNEEMEHSKHACTLRYSIGCSVAVHAFTFHYDQFKCEEPLPNGVSPAKMGAFVSSYFFPRMKEGIWAYIEDPQPNTFIIVAFFHIISYYLSAEQFQTASVYLGIAARVGCMMPMKSSSQSIACIVSSMYWTILVNHDECLTSLGFTPVISNREWRLEFCGSLLTDLNNLSNEDLIQFQYHIAYARQSAIVRDSLDTFYGENSPSPPSTDNLERFLTAWGQWWDSLPPSLHPTTDYRYSNHKEFMTALRMGMIYEIGIMDFYLPFINHEDDSDADSDSDSGLDNQIDSQPTRPLSLARHAARMCFDRAVAAVRYVLAIHKHHGCRFPLFELGRACEVIVQNMAAEDLQVVALARGYLALAWKMVTETVAYRLGEVHPARYARYLRGMMKRHGVKVEEASIVDEEDYLRPLFVVG
ncbi:hypothetical protein BC938DRAFT_471772 [Jimgerdemannia flammicorona]|uniref:Zn(2)-C6 fungal-type domain-containing protein n=1 Tax=Jimgerdemannia flammicorona TaxID=994334 RepID=A0A433Q7F7_9FUNG|nr:hypothetical protein BC938DRAFT_471772 [Jimgerdemannia flammicorona]